MTGDSAPEPTTSNALATRIAAIAAPLRDALRDGGDMQQSVNIGDVAIAVRRLDALREDLEQGLIS